MSMSIASKKFQSYVSYTDDSGQKCYIIFIYDVENKTLRFQSYGSYKAYKANKTEFDGYIKNVTKDTLLRFSVYYGHTHESLEKNEDGFDVKILYHLGENGLGTEPIYRFADWAKAKLVPLADYFEPDVYTQKALENDWFREYHSVDDPVHNVFYWNKRCFARFGRIVRDWASRL